MDAPSLDDRYEQVLSAIQQEQVRHEESRRTREQEYADEFKYKGRFYMAICALGVFILIIALVMQLSRTHIYPVKSVGTFESYDDTRFAFATQNCSLPCTLPCVEEQNSNVSRQVACWKLRQESGYVADALTGRVRLRNDTATCFDLQRDCVVIAAQMAVSNSQRAIYYRIDHPTSYQTTEPHPDARFRTATTVLWTTGGVTAGYGITFFIINWCFTPK
jgi:hypothetical protein